MGQTVQIFRTEKEWFLNITLGILKYFCHIPFCTFFANQANDIENSNCNKNDP